MKRGELLNTMLVLATTKHSGQLDRGGLPYVLHTLTVMHYLKTTDEELQCIALGHDIVEDCGVTYADLANLGFTQRIIDGIRGMTKVPGETNEEYLSRIKANPDCIRVKLQDLRHNSDIRRLKGVTAKDVARIEKYHRMYMELKELV